MRLFRRPAAPVAPPRPAPELPPKESFVAVGGISGEHPADLEAFVLVTLGRDGIPRLTNGGADALIMPILLDAIAGQYLHERAVR